MLIVLNDPHSPWERAAGLTTNMSGEIDEDPSPMNSLPAGEKKVFRSKVPWVALIGFDPADLKLEDEPSTRLLKITAFILRRPC